jgi:cytochrome b561
MIKNTRYSYGYFSKGFHWAMAVLFLVMFIVAYIMINISQSDLMYSLYDFHKATGMLLFCLVMLRLSWRLVNVQPDLVKSLPIWQRRAAKLNILVLYFLMFSMPMAGFLTSTLGGHDISIYHLFLIPALAHNQLASDFFSTVHEILSYILIAAFVLHVTASFYHHYFIKDDVLKRMWLISGSRTSLKK